MSPFIMGIFSWLFSILFLFLMFIFVVILISFLKRKKYTSFEPEICILIPSYNEEKNIKKCLDSIFTSNYPSKKIEVIVIDDGSTDKTKEIVKSYKNVILLTQNHKGKSEALNYGVKHSKKEIIVCIDADTIIEKKCIQNLVMPLQEKDIGATTGTSKVANLKGIWATFQNIEYHYNNLIRKGFSDVFKTGIWFFGALSCYKKSALVKIGYFKKDTLTEDMDIALELESAGFRTIHVADAYCYTIVPTTFKEIYKQRSRWWMGVLQALIKNRSLFSIKKSPSILFLYINQFWWSFYAIVSLPIIIYQVFYWMPNTNSVIDIFSYLFRWFSLIGPFYVLYKIPEGWLNFYNFFGVFSGIISSICIIIAIKYFKDKVNFKNTLAILFYFPYTIVLNIIICASIISYGFSKKRFFIR